jgi:hypothetical protein
VPPKDVQHCWAVQSGGIWVTQAMFWPTAQQHPDAQPPLVVHVAVAEAPQPALAQVGGGCGQVPPKDVQHCSAVQPVGICVTQAMAWPTAQQHPDAQSLFVVHVAPAAAPQAPLAQVDCAAAGVGAITVLISSPPPAAAPPATAVLRSISRRERSSGRVSKLAAAVPERQWAAFASVS